MNVKKKILVLVFTLGALLWGCDSLVYDDLKDCPQGVYVKFYTKTPCASDPAFIGDVSHLHLFAFDDRGVLVSATSHKKVSLTGDYEVLVPVKNGYFTIIGWAGIDEHFTMPAFKEGVTTRKDVVLKMNTVNKKAGSLGTHKLWHGESPVVLLRDPEKYGSEYGRTSINMQEVTNRINVEVELHESIRKNVEPKNFSIEIKSANGTLNIDRSMPLKGDVLTYPGVVSYTENSVKSLYSLLDLKTGYNSTITIKDIKKNKVIWEGDLIGSILLKNPNVNLNCQHDFDVKFVIKDKCLDCATYVCWSILVNNWIIHSYETELGL